MEICPKCNRPKISWKLIQGDARNLSNLLNGEGAAIVSPPYAETDPRGGEEKLMRRLADDPTSNWYHRSVDSPAFHSYVGKRYKSQSEGNIGDLKDSPAGVVSPPYSQADDRVSKGKIQEGWVAENLKPGRTYEAGAQGASEGQIGNLKDVAGIVSPPYAESLASDKPEERGGLLGKPHPTRGNIWARSFSKDYAGNSANIGNLRDMAGITSPPYEQSLQSGELSEKIILGIVERTNRRYGKNRVKVSGQRRTIQGQSYDPNDGNLAKEEGPTYLSAMKQVYGEAYAAGISPLVVVVKNPTRNGQLRRLDLDTAALLEAVGYRLVDYHRAVLFQTETQATLDGGEKKQYRGRVSFFKRLSLLKGSPAALWEDVLISVIPGSREGEVTGIVSPPYKERAPYEGVWWVEYRGPKREDGGPV